jgi:hypothetical protein
VQGGFISSSRIGAAAAPGEIYSSDELARLRRLLSFPTENEELDMSSPRMWVLIPRLSFFFLAPGHTV